MKRVRSTDVQPDEPAITLILDSGAYSAWTKGIAIDIDEYIAYIKKHEHLLAHYVALDVIPGQLGQNWKSRGQAATEEAARKSFDNYMYMRKAGLRPIPVIHQGEKLKWFHQYMDAGADYLGVSPATKAANKKEMITWLDSVFTELTDDRGVAIVKTHGFGVSSFEIMKRYPWTTVDSTSWALTAAFGGILLPVYRAGKPDYAAIPLKVTVSKYEDRKAPPADHYDIMGPAQQKLIAQYLKDEIGVTVEQASLDYEVRARAVVHFMMQFQDAIGEVRFTHRGKGGTLL